MVKFMNGNRKTLCGNYELIFTAKDDAASCSLSIIDLFLDMFSEKENIFRDFGSTFPFWQRKVYCRYSKETELLKMYTTLGHRYLAYDTRPHNWRHR